MFLRRINEHLKTLHWTAVAVDFVIVVAGILIAFQITAWNESRLERVRELDYLTRIEAELDRSIADIEASLRVLRRREDMGRLLIQSVSDPEIVRTDPGRYVTAIVQTGYTFSPTMRSHTFEEIKSAADLAIFRDKALMADLSEFYTSVVDYSQWNYLRELRQTEYTRRAAGILNFEQVRKIDLMGGIAKDVSSDEAMAVRERMLSRPALVEWLPTMVDRRDEAWQYQAWLKAANDLRARVRANLGATRGIEGSDTGTGER